MDADFWHQRWETDDTGWNQEAPNRLLTEYWNQLALPAGNRVFVPMCGMSVDMTWLRDAGFRVTGVELSESAVQRFFAQHGMTPEISQEQGFTTYECDGIRILAGDIFRLTADRLQDIAAVYDRAALIALPPETRDAYVELMHRAVPENAVTLLITFEKPPGDTDGPPFSVDQQNVARLFSQSHSIDVLGEQPFDRKGMPCREVAYRLCRRPNV